MIMWMFSNFGLLSIMPLQTFLFVSFSVWRGASPPFIIFLFRVSGLSLYAIPPYSCVLLSFGKKLRKLKVSILTWIVQNT